MPGGWSHRPTSKFQRIYRPHHRIYVHCERCALGGRIRQKGDLLDLKRCCRVRFITQGPGTAQHARIEKQADTDESRIEPGRVRHPGVCWRARVVLLELIIDYRGTVACYDQAYWTAFAQGKTFSIRVQATC